MLYPNVLAAGSKVAVCAFSSGVAEPYHARLELVLSHMQQRGFELVLDPNLKHNHQHVSASKEVRAKQLMTYLLDDSIAAIMPPWGGELAMEILPLLDFDKLQLAKPKWLIGFSDVSTVQLALTSRLNWASIHCANLMQLIPAQQDELTAQLFHVLAHGKGSQFSQQASNCYELKQHNMCDAPSTPFNLTEPTKWKTLNFPQTGISGRLIGGCLDTLIYTLDSPYFDLPAFCLAHTKEGVILFIENAELSPTAWLRALLMLKQKGHINRLNGLLIGRHAASQQGKAFDFETALKQADLAIPIVYDMDIGHIAPNLTLVNGAVCELSPQLELKQSLI